MARRYRCKVHFPVRRPTASFKNGRKRCEGCGKYKYLSKHHILPRRVVPSNNGRVIELCPDCHHEVELLISKGEMRILRNNLSIYTDALDAFQKGERA